MGKKIAIVGSGCSGLGALWALKSTDHEVHLFEKSDRLGGHTNTVQVETKSSQVNVDTGFIVMNTATYRQYPPHPTICSVSHTHSS
jgi:predicted NAD/FAD-binding protein